MGPQFPWQKHFSTVEERASDSQGGEHNLAALSQVCWIGSALFSTTDVRLLSLSLVGRGLCSLLLLFPSKAARHPQLYTPSFQQRQEKGYICELPCAWSNVNAGQWVSEEEG